MIKSTKAWRTTNGTPLCLEQTRRKRKSASKWKKSNNATKKTSSATKKEETAFTKKDKQSFAKSAELLRKPLLPKEPLTKLSAQSWQKKRRKLIVLLKSKQNLKNNLHPKQKMRPL